jgi:hypothetical protein
MDDTSYETTPQCVTRLLEADGSDAPWAADLGAATNHTITTLDQWETDETDSGDGWWYGPDWYPPGTPIRKAAVVGALNRYDLTLPAGKALTLWSVELDRVVISEEDADAGPYQATIFPTLHLAREAW